MNLEGERGGTLKCNYGLTKEAATNGGWGTIDGRGGKENSGRGAEDM